MFARTYSTITFTNKNTCWYFFILFSIEMSYTCLKLCVFKNSADLPKLSDEVSFKLFFFNLLFFFRVKMKSLFKIYALLSFTLIVIFVHLKTRLLRFRGKHKLDFRLFCDENINCAGKNSYPPYQPFDFVCVSFRQRLSLIQLTRWFLLAFLSFYDPKTSVSTLP